ncbi:MAG: gliding motility-associated C-terminal domain-containing protein [Phaeodactylibacter sp.]|nr:gliding motility-associated C-terminal domain-containing protein [Phaeodactylibacter sp.]MCB9053240.1 gliding motility-associated C-terminal domain-containing protein [Lewinellaceae bacterium]
MRHLYHRISALVVILLLLLCPPSLFGQGAPDCAGAVVLCSSASISFNPQGIGAVNDFASAANNQGCLLSGERNTAWYYFEFNSSMPGNSVITFTIAPNGVADYDFAIYGPGVSCGGLGSPVRCSYAAPSAPTGLGNGATEFSEGAGGDGFVAPLTVQPGQGFYLVVDNFSSNNTSFNMTWGGSAAPFLDCTATPPCAIALNYSPSYNVCAGGGPITLQGTINGANGSQTINWSATNGGDAYLNNPFVANPSVNIPAGVSGTFQYTIMVDQAGCMEEATITVNASATPMPTITGDDIICQGQTTTLTAPPGFAAYRWSNNMNGPSITVGPGTYTVTVTNNLGCQGTGTFTVSQLPTPIPNITGPAQLCPNGNAILNAGAGYDSYQWSTGSPNPQSAITGPGIYQVTVTQNGCVGTGQIFVAVAPDLLVTPSGDNTICQGQSADINAGGGFASYQWSNGSQEQINTVTAPGTYSVTVSNTGGCTGTASFTVSPVPPPEPAITGNLAICPGNSTSLDAGTSFDSYLWSTGNPNSLITVNMPGTYSVTVTNAQGCTGTDEVVVTAAPGPMPAINGDTEICAGASTQLIATPGFSSYQWSNTNTGAAIQANVGGTYTVTVTDATGCQGTASIEVVENSNPVPAIQGPAGLCPGAGTTLALNESYQSYLWSTGGTLDSALVPGAGNYSVTVTDANGCQGTAAFSIQEFSSPSLPVGVEVEYCQGDTATLSAPSGFASYIWGIDSTDSNISVSTPGDYAYTVTDNNGCTAGGSVLAVENALPSFAISGELEYCETASTFLEAPSGYTAYQWSTGSTDTSSIVSAPGLVSVVVTDSNGCSSSQSVTVVENPLPVAGITGILEFCTDGTTTLSADGAFSEYLWSTGNSQPSISVGQAGNYSLTITDGNGCSSNTSVAVAEIPELQPVITGTLEFCSGTSTTLQAEPGYQSYNWSDGSSGSSITVSAPGTVSLTVADNNGCEGSASVEVSELSLPEPVITGIDFFCEGASTTIDAGGGYSAYAWMNNDTTRELTVTQPGTYTVTVTDASGCLGEGAFEVDEIPTPAPVINGELLFCPEGSTELTGSSGFTSYLWSNGETAAFTVVDLPGNYELTVTDSYGCAGSTMVQAAHFATSPPAITGDLNYCPGESTSLNAESGFTSYIWSDGSVSPNIAVNANGTYGLTVTDTNGCQTAAAVSVEAYPVAPPQITGDAAFCAGGAANLEANAGFDSYLWSTGGTQPALTVSSGGIYGLTVTDVNGCNTSNSFSVTQNPLPQVNIGGSTSYCIGGFTTLNAGAQYSAYSWSTGSTQPTIQVNQMGPYGLTVTDANGCVGNTEVQVNEDIELSPVISGPLAFCPGTSTTLDAGEGFQDYQWSDNSAGQSLVVSSPGVYSVTVADASGCTGDTEVVVSEHPAPMPIIEGVLEYCAGSSTNLAVTGGNFATYNWSTGAFEPGITATQPGTYSVTITDGNGCVETTSVGVQENPLPVFQISGALSFCEGDATELTATGGFAGYLWSNGAVEPGITVQSPGNYGLTVTNSFGCTSQQAVSTTQIPQPQADAGQPRVINCYNSEVALGGTGSSQGGSIVYQWAGPGIDASNANQQFPSVSLPGAYTLTTVNTTLGCASEPSVVQVTDDTDDPVVVLEVLDVLDCTTSSVLIDAGNSSTGQNFIYQWYDANMDPLGNQGLSLEASIASTYFLLVTDTVSGCDALASVDVAENIEYPIAEAGQPQHLDCDVNTANLDGGGSQQGPNIVYNWYTIGGNILNGGDGLNPEVDEPGAYIIVVTDITNNCTNSDTVQVTQDVNVPIADAGAAQEIDCLNPTVTLNGAGSSTGSQYAHQWAFGQAGNIVGSGLDYTAEEAGTYFIIVTDTDNGCTNTDAVVVSQNAAAPSNINLALDRPTCFGDTDGSVIISGVVGGTPPYLYSFDGQPLNNQAAFLNLAAGTYSVLVQDAIGCEFELEATLADGNDLMVDLGEDRTVKLGEEVSLFARVNIDESEIAALSWNAADSLSCANCLRPVVRPSTSGSYFIEVVDDNGCVATDQVILFLDKTRRLFVPNVFSPNGDGQNDVFMPFAGPEVTKIRAFEVYNRWGEPIFEVYNFPPNDPTYGWDGTYRAELYNSAAFAWFAEVEFVDGVVEIFKGDVILMR